MSTANTPNNLVRIVLPLLGWKEWFGLEVEREDRGRRLPAHHLPFLTIAGDTMLTLYPLPRHGGGRPGGRGAPPATRGLPARSVPERSGSECGSGNRRED